MVPFESCFKNYYVKFMLLKGDDAFKFRRRIFRFKTLIYV